MGEEGEGIQGRRDKSMEGRKAKVATKEMITARENCSAWL